MDIRGLGTSLAEQLVAKKLVRNLSDIYELRVQDLQQLMRMGEKSARNIIHAIEQSKRNAKLDRLIYGLGIPHVGRALATNLATNFPSIDKLMGADEHALRSAGFELVVSAAIAQWFANKANQGLIKRLRQAGINPKLQRKGARLEGKTLVFTGELARMTREQAKETVIQQGGRVSDSVSRRTDFLVVGSQPGGAKTESAGKYGTRTLSETEFLNLIK